MRVTTRVCLSTDRRRAITHQGCVEDFKVLKSDIWLNPMRMKDDPSLVSTQDESFLSSGMGILPRRSGAFLSKSYGVCFAKRWSLTGVLIRQDASVW